jgi:hypothetical protein
VMPSARAAASRRWSEAADGPGEAIDCVAEACGAVPSSVAAVGFDPVFSSSEDRGTTTTPRAARIHTIPLTRVSQSYSQAVSTQIVMRARAVPSASRPSVRANAIRTVHDLAEARRRMSEQTEATAVTTMSE